MEIENDFEGRNSLFENEKATLVFSSSSKLFQKRPGLPPVEASNFKKAFYPQKLFEQRNSLSRSLVSYHSFRKDIDFCSKRFPMVVFNNKIGVNCLGVDLSSRSSSSFNVKAYSPFRETRDFFSSLAFEKEINSLLAIAEFNAGVSVTEVNAETELASIPEREVELMQLRNGHLAAVNALSEVKVFDLRDFGSPQVTIFLERENSEEFLWRNVDLKTHKLVLDSSHGSVFYDLRNPSAPLQSDLGPFLLDKLTFLTESGLIVADFTGERIVAPDSGKQVQFTETLLDAKFDQENLLLTLLEEPSGAQKLKAFDQALNELSCVEVESRKNRVCVPLAQNKAMVLNKSLLSVYRLH